MNERIKKKNLKAQLTKTLDCVVGKKTLLCSAMLALTEDHTADKGDKCEIVLRGFVF